jgi:hypothetical protein
MCEIRYPLTNHNHSAAAFRIPWGIQMVPAFILLVGLFFFPYSPRWLASKDRYEEWYVLLFSMTSCKRNAYLCVQSSSACQASWQW